MTYWFRVINKEGKNRSFREEEEKEAKTWLPSCSIPPFNHFQAGSVKINDIFLVYRVFFCIREQSKKKKIVRINPWIWAEQEEINQVQIWQKR